MHAEGREEEEVVSVSCRSMRKVAGSCVGGIVVSIAAFQAVDPGSIPGQRNSHFVITKSSSRINKAGWWKEQWGWILFVHTLTSTKRLTLPPLTSL